MSEPRKLNTGDAHNVYHAGEAQRSAATEQQQYEEARRRAREAAAAGGRRTRSFNRVQSSDVEKYRAAQTGASAPRTVHTAGRTLNTGHTAGAPRTVHTPAAQQPARQAPRPAQPVQRTAPAAQPAARTAAPRRASAAQPAQQPAQQELTMAQRQALALQRQAAAKQNAAGARARVQHLDLNQVQSERAAFDFNSEAADFKAEQPAAQASAKAAAGGAAKGAAGKTTYRSGGGASGGKPPKGPGKNGKGGKGAGPYNGKGKKKRKRTWWKVLLGTFLALVLIFGGTIAFILHSIAPETGGTTLDRIFNTPQEYAGKELNFLMVGVDRTGEGSEVSADGTNDGNTDMILYVHFNNETGELKMLQIPRDTMVTTDRSVSGNYRINNVARTQGDGNLNVNALCEQVATMYKLPVDGYVMIHLEMLTQLVDTFGGIELYVPQDIDYTQVADGGSSVIHEGYQTLDGAAVEFLLRARKVYADGDIGRLNMQRQFYAALFRKIKDIGNIWDVAKLAPAVLGYMETSLPITDLVSFAVSVLNIDSSKIMICQMPVYSGAPYYNGQSVVYPARQQDADLLNQYFRENTGPVDASELELCDSVSEIGFDLSGYTATDPNVQYMGSLMDEQAAAQADPDQNLDGSNAVTYVDPTPDPNAASEGTDGEEAASSETTDDAA